MRRPNVKWLFKTACLLVIAGTLFILITGYISASPFTNKPINIKPNAVPYKQHPNGKHDSPIDQPVGPAPEEQDSRREHKLPKVPPVEQPLIKNNYNDNHDELNNDILEEEREQSQDRQEKEREQQQQPQLLPPNHTKKDWHDYTMMERDAKRVGFGEQGKRATNNDESTKDMERKMSLENGFNAYLSDMISVNRSVPDIRNKG